MDRVQGDQGTVQGGQGIGWVGYRVGKVQGGQDGQGTGWTGYRVDRMNKVQGGQGIGWNKQQL